jgi:glycine dehydrogenase subunit 1
MPYTPATPTDVREMLDVVGVESVDDLFAAIPAELRFQGEIDVPEGVGEQQLIREFGTLAARNVDLDREISFLGYGSYDHFVPAVCRSITSRSEFATAYTPYQPEISQGTLQAIFEYQSAICAITGLPVSNASLYDGATAIAEAAYVSEQTTRRSKVVVLRSVHAHARGVLDTYAEAYGMHLVDVPFDPATGVTQVSELESVLDDETACVIIQQPNAFGALEDAPALVAAASEVGAVPVVSCDPLSLGVLEAPGAYGAGIAVGDGQALGNAPGFGGPTFGFMAATDAFLRRMPGRIVGQTLDIQGTPGYVLTLQTREQHIRREKATSNICTNQALNALAGVVYLSWLGPQGLEELGTLLLDRSERVREALDAIDGVEPMFDDVVFKERVFRLPVPAAEVIARCKRRGVHPGYAVGQSHPELGPNALLVSVTERRTDADIELLAEVLAEAVQA